MFKYFSFHIKQSFFNMKKQWAILVCLSFCLSMVAGLSYFSEVTQEDQFNNSLNSIADIEIVHYQLINTGLLGNTFIQPRLGYSENFAISENLIIKSISESKLDLIDYYRYGILTMEKAFFCISDFETIDFSDSEDVLSAKKAIDASEIKLMVSDDDFYTSSRFNDSFKVIQGRTPTKPEEILIDFNFAKKYSLNINEIANITLLIGRFMETYMYRLKDFQLENVTISGFYLPTQLVYELDSETFEYSYTYQDHLSNLTYIENEDKFDGPAIFSWYNFSGPDYNHPFQKLYIKIANDQNFWAYLMQGSYTRSGYILEYNRESIKFNSLDSKIKEISYQSKELSFLMPWDVSLVDKISYQLNQLYDQFQKTRFLIQLLNLPLIVFSILISRSFIKKQDKKELILALCRRGVPLKIIKKQQLYQIIIYSIITSIIGIIFGIFTFYLYQNWLGSLFYKSTSAIFNPKFSGFTLIFTFSIGLILFSLANFTTNRKERKKSIFDLANPSNFNENYDDGYDERILSNKFQQEGKNIEESIHKEGPSRNGASKSPVKKRNKISQKKSKKVKNVYVEDIDFPKSKISKLTIILMSLGVVPLLINLLIYLGNIFTISDMFEDLTQIFTYGASIVYLLSIFGYVLFMIGLIRIILIEKPKILARISKIISYPFVGKYNKILSLRIINKQKWIKIMNILVIFFGILVISNILNNSQYQYEILGENMNIGADIRIEMEEILLNNQSELQNFENSLKILTDEEDEEIINEIVSCSIDNNAELAYTFSNINYSLNIPFISLDLNSYLNIVQIDDKPLPYTNFEKDVRKLIEYNSVLENSFTAVFVTSEFLVHTSLFVGDKITIEHYIWDSQAGTNRIELIEALIFSVFDIFPGIYSSSDENVILTDINSLNQSNSLLHGQSLIQLIDLGISSEYKFDVIEDLIDPIFETACPSPIYEFYAHGWNDVNNADASIELGESGFYKLIFMDLIPIGIFLIIEISLMQFIIFKEKSNQDLTLIKRGLKKNKILKIFMVESLIISSISLILGLIFGSGYALVITKVMQLITVKNAGGIPYDISFPIYYQGMSILYIFLGMLLIPSIIFTIIYKINLHNDKKEFQINSETEKIRKGVI